MRTRSMHLFLSCSSALLCGCYNSDCISEAFLISPLRRPPQKISQHQYNRCESVFPPRPKHEIVPSTTTTSLFDSKIPTEIPTEIPKEIKDKIYEAEAKTPAAEGRRSRVIAYVVIGLTLALSGTLNVLLTTMKKDGVDMEEYGFGWTRGIPLLTNGLGGWFDILGAGVCLILAELEFKTRDETATKIWLELKRRKESGEMPLKRKVKQQQQQQQSSTSKGGVKKGASKKKKRLAALAEVILEQEDNNNNDGTIAVATETNTIVAEEERTGKDTKEAEEEDETKGGGFVDKLKNFYKEADALAASQALLLNKNLEDKGIVDKITDETGLKVIGKDAASKLEGGEETTTNVKKEKQQ